MTINKGLSIWPKIVAKLYWIRPSRTELFDWSLFFVEIRLGDGGVGQQRPDQGSSIAMKIDDSMPIEPELWKRTLIFTVSLEHSNKTKIDVRTNWSWTRRQRNIRVDWLIRNKVHRVISKRDLLRTGGAPVAIQLCRGSTRQSCRLARFCIDKQWSNVSLNQHELPGSIFFIFLSKVDVESGSMAANISMSTTSKSNGRERRTRFSCVDLVDRHSLLERCIRSCKIFVSAS